MTVPVAPRLRDFGHNEAVNADERAGEAELLELAAQVRRGASILPTDLERFATADVVAGVTEAARGNRVVGPVIRLALRLLGAILASVRSLVLLAAGLAVLNVGLFLVPRRGESLFVFGGALVLAVMLIPAFALHHVGKRFAAFRDALGTLAQRLPEILTVPDALAAEAAEVAALVEESSTKSFFVRLVSRARILLRIRRMIGGIAEQHRDLMGAAGTAMSYGPLDVLLATYGVVGIGVLAACVPASALFALLSVV